MPNVSGSSQVNGNIADLMRPTTTDRKPSSSLDKDAFLKLLVAQLQYQNPLDPSDPTQFMAQTAQFTMVEKLQDVADQTKSATIAQKLSTASGLIGKQVTYIDDGVEKSGVVASARLTDTTTLLHVGDADVDLELVLGVSPAPTS